MENAISVETGERDIITAWMGILFIPFLVIVGILGIIGIILYFIKKLRASEP